VQILASTSVPRGQLVKISVAGEKIDLAVKIEAAPDPRGVAERLRAWRDQAAPERDVLLASAYIAPSVKRTLEAAGVGWAEAGGIHLKTAAHLIHIEGRARPERSKLNISSPAAQKTIRALLENPKDLWTLKAITDMTGIHLSSASRALDRLVRHGLVERARGGGWVVVDGAVLLDSWLSLRQSSQNKIVERHFFTRAPLAKVAAQIVDAAGEHQVAFTGRFAAEMVKPVVAAARLDLYIHPFFDVSTWAERTLKLMPLPGPEEARVVLKHSSDEGAFVAASGALGMPIVGKGQLIADLLAEGGRSEQAADALRELWGIDAITET
jgi:DNA-binding transcriptional ArsR family regulator